jgi:hypothetical protein
MLLPETRRCQPLAQNLELRFAAWIWLHYANDRVNEDAWSEILPGTFLAFARSFFEQAFERCTFNIHVHRRPAFLIDHGDDTFEIYRVIEARSRLSKYIGKQSTRFPQLAQYISVVIGECCPREGLETRPVLALWYVYTSPILRAMQTAQEICKISKTEMLIAPELREYYTIWGFMKERVPCGYLGSNL